MSPGAKCRRDTGRGRVGAGRLILRSLAMLQVRWRSRSLDPGYCLWRCWHHPLLNETCPSPQTVHSLSWDSTWSSTWCRSQLAGGLGESWVGCGCSQSLCGTLSLLSELCCFCLFPSSLYPFPVECLWLGFRFFQFQALLLGGTIIQVVSTIRAVSAGKSLKHFPLNLSENCCPETPLHHPGHPCRPLPVSF